MHTSKDHEVFFSEETVSFNRAITKKKKKKQPHSGSNHKTAIITVYLFMARSRYDGLVALTGSR